MPETWKAHSKKILGYVAPQTQINEKYVTAAIIEIWLEQGFNAYQIGLMYNGGEIKEKKGTNKFGAKYDTAAYAKKLVANLSLVERAEAAEINK